MTLSRRGRRRVSRPKAAAYMQHKETARTLLAARTAHFAPVVGVTVGRIVIRDTRRSWGSCSSKGNLNFSYKLLFLPACWRDYIIVHELCHLHHLNHGALFWQEVERVMPEYRTHMVALRQFERSRGTAPQVLLKHQREHLCAYCEVGSL